jgi:hypothetical protein
MTAADPNANTLSLSLPTDLLTGGGNGGGLNFSYNFGPNVNTLANSAYGFLGQQFAGAQSFESNAIAGTQDFLSNATQPIIQATANASDTYFSSLLSSFNLTAGAQQNLGTQALQAQTQVANASISASKKAQGGGSLFSSIFGGCFITTAVCKYSGLPDDCSLLQIMRAWRDSWMQENDKRRAMVEHYYIVAPDYVERIGALSADDQRIIWDELERLIIHCCGYVVSGQNEIALAYYMAVVEFARVASESAP